MNDQTPSVPATPPNRPRQSPSNSSRELPGLSDDEAFAMLAESMAEEPGSGGGGSVADPTQAQNQPPPSDDGPTVFDRPSDYFQIPPMVKIQRGTSPLPALSGPPRNGHGPCDWTTPALVGEQWEVVEGFEPGTKATITVDEDLPGIHGQVTEIIDLNSIPPVINRAGFGAKESAEEATDSDSEPGGEEDEPADDDHADAPPLIEPDPQPLIRRVPAPGQRIEPEPRIEAEPEVEAEPEIEAEPARKRSERVDGSILAPMEPVTTGKDPKPGAPTGKTGAAGNSLPPLVFLDSNDDILPAVGEAGIEVGEGNREDVAVGWDEGDPRDRRTATSGGGEDGAESMAEYQSSLDQSGPMSAVLGEPVVDLTVDGRADDRLVASEYQEPANVLFPVDSPEPATDGRFDELVAMFEQYSGPVIAVIASIAPDRHSVDEALMDTFAAAWQAEHSMAPDQPRGPWMFTLARRTAAQQVELHRHRDRMPGLNGYPTPTHRQDEKAAVEKAWEAWEIRLAVDQLSGTEHDVLRLTHAEGRIHPEIAAELHTTVGAVKSRSYSGSHRLVQLLDHVIRPDAEASPTDDQESALTWYLAGVADGSDLDAEERSAIKRVQSQLASPAAWIRPEPRAKERLLAIVERSSDGGDHGASNRVPAEGAKLVVDPSPSSEAAVAIPTPGLNLPFFRTNETNDKDKDNRPPYTSILLGLGLALIALLVLTNVFGLYDAAEDGQVLSFEMQPADAVPDATGIVQIASTETGTRYEFEFEGLEATESGSFYAVWIQNTAADIVVPLGSFTWQTSEDPVVLSGPIWSDDFDTLLITRGATSQQASSEDTPIMSVSLD